MEVMVQGATETEEEGLTEGLVTGGEGTEELVTETMVLETDNHADEDVMESVWAQLIGSIDGIYGVIMR